MTRARRPAPASRPSGPDDGCCTTARVRGGRVERLERHARRLRRDAGRLGLPLPDPREVEALLDATAREHFAARDGIVRAEWSAAQGDQPRLSATARPFDPLPFAWRAVTSNATHPGPIRGGGAKQIAVAAWDHARAELVADEIEESLLFDAQGRLVEGSRTNLIAVLPGPRLVTPARALGGVEGLGLDCIREGPWAIEEGMLEAQRLEEVSALLAVNVVRGIAPIVRLDRRPIGAQGALWAQRLGGCFGPPSIRPRLEDAGDPSPGDA